jgi:hypothetical protein
MMFNSEPEEYTVCVQIGNSDDKLTQKEWSEFCLECLALIQKCKTHKIHFYGFSPGGSPWQNACWVFVTGRDDVYPFKQELAKIREKYRQDSVAVLVGTTEFA